MSPVYSTFKLLSFQLPGEAEDGGRKGGRKGAGQHPCDCNIF